MSKLNIDVLLHNKTINDIYKTSVKGIKNDNKIIFYDNKVNNILLIQNTDILYKRISDEYEIEIFFSKNNSYGKYIMNNFSFLFEVKVNSISILDNKIVIDYITNINNEDVLYNYTIEYRGE